MLISIVVPIYNKEKYLDRCIKSVLEQDYDDYELILVDDGSKDKSLQICNQYAKDNLNIKVIYKENGGVSSARKAGANIAKGGYICALDADDYLDNNVLKSIDNLLKSNNPDVYQFSHKKVYKNKIVEYSLGLDNGFYNREFIQKNIVNKFFTSNNFSYTICSKIIKKEIFLKCQNKVPDSVTNGEDYDFCYFLYNNINSLYVNNNIFYMYDQNEDSVTHQSWYKIINSLVHNCEFLKSLDLSVEDVQVVDNSIYEYSISVLLECVKFNEGYKQFKKKSKEMNILIKKYKNKPKCLSYKLKIFYYLCKYNIIFFNYILMIFGVKKINRSINQYSELITSKNEKN